MICALLLALALCFTACSGDGGSTSNTQQPPSNNTPTPTPTPPAGPTTIKIGVGAGPCTGIAEQSVANAAEVNIKLEVVTFDTYDKVLAAVESGTVDFGLFPTAAYLEYYNSTNGTKLVTIGNGHNETMGVYSEKINSLDRLANGASIAIPNDPAEGARALALLENAGLIKLSGAKASVDDISENPKNIIFRLVPSNLLPLSLDKVDAAVIGYSFAYAADLSNGFNYEPTSSEVNSNTVVFVAKEAREKDANLLKTLTEIKQINVMLFVRSTYPDRVAPMRNP